MFTATVSQLWGERMSSPVGLAAGFDKNGEAIDGELAWITYPR